MTRARLAGTCLAVTALFGACGTTGSSNGPSPTAAVSVSPGSATPSAVVTPTVAASAAVAPSASPAPVAPIRALDAHLTGAGSGVLLAFDAAGNLYVSECAWTYAAIHRIDRSGMMTRFAGTGEPGFSGDGGPATAAQFYCPRGMTFAPDGAMYVGDHVNNRVRRIDADGTISTFAGSGPDGLDLGSYSGDGGPAIQATLQEPEQVALDRDGNLYIGDRDNNRIRKVDASGIMSTIAGNGQVTYSGSGVLGSETGVNSPFGVSVDPDGDVIFADGGNLRVRKVDRNGIITTIAGNGEDESTGDGGPATKAGIEPGDLSAAATGDVYVVDDRHHQLRRIDREGTITTIAGSGKPGVFVDGMRALDAPFTDLEGPAIDADGNLYVTDLVSVYRIDKKGILTIVAGTR